MFRFYNANAKNLFVDDCVIRCFSVAEDISWDEAYEILSDAAQSKGMMMDSADFVEGFFDERYERYCPNEMTVEEFIIKHPYGTYILSMPGHVTVVKEGINYDTFSTLNRDIWCYWCIK